MTIKVWQNEECDFAGLYDSETMLAFGPIFEGDFAADFAEAFARWEGWADHTVVRHTEWTDWLCQFHNLDGTFLCECGEQFLSNVGTLQAYSETGCPGCGKVYDADELLETFK